MEHKNELVGALTAGSNGILTIYSGLLPYVILVCVVLLTLRICLRPSGRYRTSSRELRRPSKPSAALTTDEMRAEGIDVFVPTSEVAPGNYPALVEHTEAASSKDSATPADTKEVYSPYKDPSFYWPTEPTRK